MQCSKCKDYKPKAGDGYDYFICLACGQGWSLWRINEDKEAWYNNGLFKLKTMTRIKEETMETRQGYKRVTTLPGDETFVSMIEFQGDIFVLTDGSMYKMIDECLVKQDIQIVDDDPMRPSPEFKDILIDPTTMKGDIAQ